MQKFQTVGHQIVNFVNEPRQKVMRLIYPHGTRFVVCGTSGSGKSRAIDFANSLLLESEQIAPSQDLLWQDDLLRAKAIVEDSELRYEGCLHIAFNVVSSYFAKGLEAKGVKVFWLDGGSSGSHWKP